jgi:hypothetical protein
LDYTAGHIYALAVSPNGSGSTNIFASAIGGVFRSTNNGTSWIEVNSGLPQGTLVTSFATIGNNIFAGTWNSGVFLSTNNGTNWSAVDWGL